MSVCLRLNKKIQEPNIKSEIQYLTYHNPTNKQTPWAQMDNVSQGFDIVLYQKYAH